MTSRSRNSEPCTCLLAGWCERHKIAKPAPWHRLCQTRSDYRACWDRGEGPGQHVSVESRQAHQRKIDKRHALTRRLWAELHAYVCNDATAGEQWLDKWLRKVPNFGCKCADHFREIMQRLPPDFSSPAAFHAWSIDAHNAVNIALGKPVFVV